MMRLIAIVMKPESKNTPAIKPPEPRSDPVFGNELGVGAVIVKVPGAQVIVDAQ
jgi:hypothetical protein